MLLNSDIISNNNMINCGLHAKTSKILNATLGALIKRKKRLALHFDLYSRKSFNQAP